MDTITEQQMKTTIDEALTSIYEQLFINAEKICTYNYKRWGVDLVSHTVQYFLNQPLHKQYTIVTSPSKKVSALERYLTSAMSLAIRSSTSPFYSKHRKHIESHREIWQDFDYSAYMGYEKSPLDSDKWEDMVEALPELIKGLHFYDRYLIQKHYIEQLTVREIADTTKITTYRLSRDIKSALLHLKEQLDKI